MWKEEKKRVSERIVSLNQPHVRPIVRGKAGKPTEFGAKISLSYVDGYGYVVIKRKNKHEKTSVIDIGLKEN